MIAFLFFHYTTNALMFFIKFCRAIGFGQWKDHKNLKTQTFIERIVCKCYNANMVNTNVSRKKYERSEAINDGTVE